MVEVLEVCIMVSGWKEIEVGEEEGTQIFKGQHGIDSSARGE